MRFYTKQPNAYCGLERPARSLYRGLLSQAGALLRHRTMQTRPARFLQALAPSRAELVVAVAWLLPWYGLADLGAREAKPVGVGHALSLHARHGGKATHEKRDAPHMAVWLRGGRWPQASGSPAERRATRALPRRRRPLTRQRAAWLAPLPHTPRQSHRPESGHTLASTANRTGVAERWPAPAGPHRRAGDRALSGSEAHLRRAGEFHSLPAATQPAAQPLDVRHTGPGLGTSLRLGLVDARPALPRVPRGPACGSAGRLVPCARAAAGNRSGSSGPPMGQAALQGACAAAAGRCRRDHPAGQQSRPRWEQTPGPGPAWTVRAQQRARAVSDLRTPPKAFERPPGLQGDGSGARAPRLTGRLWAEPGARTRPGGAACVEHADEGRGLRPGTLCRGWAGRAGSWASPSGESRPRGTCAAPHPHRRRTGAPRAATPWRRTA